MKVNSADPGFTGHRPQQLPRHADHPGRGRRGHPPCKLSDDGPTGTYSDRKGIVPLSRVPMTPRP
jgi:hypothetical protein